MQSTLHTTTPLEPHLSIHVAFGTRKGRRSHCRRIAAARTLNRDRPRHREQGGIHQTAVDSRPHGINNAGMIISEQT